MADAAAIVRSVYEAFGKGDLDGVLSVMADDIEWFEAEHNPYWTGGPMVGPEAIVSGLFARIPEDFDDFRVEVRRMIAEGDTVMVEARYHGTARATGKPLDAQAVHVWDFAGDKLVMWQQYVDTWQVVDVLGVPPGPGR
jgi:ketosteroid isomerase-like protein